MVLNPFTPELMEWTLPRLWSHPLLQIGFSQISKTEWKTVLFQMRGLLVSSGSALFVKILDWLQSPVTKYFSHNPVVCVEVLRPSQPNGVMSSAVSLPNHTFSGQA